MYYQPIGQSLENLQLMRMIDEQYTFGTLGTSPHPGNPHIGRTPFYGVRKLTDWLRKQGYGVKPKRVRRLMRQAGLFFQPVQFDL